jgi:hypothetical protein
MAFKPVRFFVLVALLAFITCGAVAFFTQRAAHGRTPEARAAYSVGFTAGSKVAPGEKLPNAAEMNEIAQKSFQKQGQGEPMAWKTAFESGYAEGFRKAHPGP